MIGIDSVSHVEEFSLIFTAINGHDVKMFVARERLPHLEHTPHRSVSTGAQEARQPLVGLGLPCPPENLRKPAMRQPPPTSAGTPSQAGTIRYILERVRSKLKCPLFVAHELSGF